MIYECPNCQRPQEAGQTVCPYCRAEFDGPVPSDAVVPAAVAGTVAEEDAVSPDRAASGSAALEAAAPLAGAAAPSLSEAAIAPSALVAVPPPAGASAFPPAQAYTPPVEDSQPPTAAEPPFGKLSRVLLVAFPVVLVLVLGGVFYTNSLNSDSDTPPAPTPAVHSAPPPSAVPVTSPIYLPGGGNTTSSDSNLRAKLLAGRWESKSGDYYVFNSDGTGSRGNPTKQPPEQVFLWGLVQNRVMLYMDKNETLRFNAGPDDDTIFLAGETGSYVQYSRSKTT